MSEKTTKENKSLSTLEKKLAAIAKRAPKVKKGPMLRQIESDDGVCGSTVRKLKQRAANTNPIMTRESIRNRNEAVARKEAVIKAEVAKKMES